MPGPTDSRIQHVFRWDLDKTYLRTKFGSMGALLKTAVETARDKQAYPGAPGLLRALGQNRRNHIAIVSGSPRQMRRVLATKLALDGIHYHEFVLKKNLSNLLRGRFRALRSQIPYKLPAILASRLHLPGSPPETLFGDDAEADAIIYSLYADLLAGDIPLDELRKILVAARAYEDEIERTLELAARLPHSPSVARILIHLDQRSPTATFSQYGTRLVPIYNYFQAALVLYADGVLNARQVLFVGQEMLASGEFELGGLANSLQDLMRRGRLSTETATQLALEARHEAASGALAGGDLPPFEEIAWAFAVRVRQLGGCAPVEWPAGTPRLDFVSLVDREHDERG